MWGELIFHPMTPLMEVNNTFSIHTPVNSPLIIYCFIVIQYTFGITVLLRFQIYSPYLKFTTYYKNSTHLKTHHTDQILHTFCKKAQFFGCAPSGRMSVKPNVKKKKKHHTSSLATHTNTRPNR